MLVSESKHTRLPRRLARLERSLHRREVQEHKDRNKRELLIDIGQTICFIQAHRHFCLHQRTSRRNRSSLHGNSSGLDHPAFSYGEFGHAKKFDAPVLHHDLEHYFPLSTFLSDRTSD